MQPFGKGKGNLGWERMWIHRSRKMAGGGGCNTRGRANSVDGYKPLITIFLVKGKIDAKVIVAGAGPVGLVTALTLNKRGIPVEIIERDDRPGTHSYALALHPATVKLLRELGMEAEFREGGLSLQRIAFMDEAEERFELKLDEIQENGDGLLVVGQNHLEETLIAPLLEAGVPIHWNHRLASLKQDPSGVDLELERLSEGMSGYAMARLEWQVDRELSRRAEYLVGADGHLSMVRRKLGIEFPKVASTQSFAVFEFKTDYKHENKARIVFGKNGTNILWPLPGGYCRWGFEIDESEAEQYSRDKDRLFVQVGSHGYHALETGMLEQMIAERAPWFDGSVGHFRWRMIVRFEKRLAESFGNDRVWLAGDAGHLAAPIGMQSMNIGIREGKQLATILADVIEGKAGKEKLDAYRLDREREWRTLLGMEGKLVPGESTDPFLAKHADKLLDCLPASLESLPTFATALDMAVSS